MCSSHLEGCMELLGGGLAHLLHHSLQDALQAEAGLRVVELHPVQHALQWTCAQNAVSAGLFCDTSTR